VIVGSAAKPFNYSAMNNVAARKAKGDILVFLNNDMTIESPYWLHDMAVLASEDSVGLSEPCCSTLKIAYNTRG
jgi:GT2 family glycosyltransferase